MNTRILIIPLTLPIIKLDATKGGVLKRKFLISVLLKLIKQELAKDENIFVFGDNNTIILEQEKKSK